MRKNPHFMLLLILPAVLLMIFFSKKEFSNGQDVVAILYGQNLKGLNLAGGDFSQTIFMFCDFRNDATIIHGISFKNATLLGCLFCDAKVEDSNFTGANLDFSSLIRTEFLGRTSLRQSSLKFSDAQAAFFPKDGPDDESLHHANYLEAYFYPGNGPHMDLTISNIYESMAGFKYSLIKTEEGRLTRLPDISFHTYLAPSIADKKTLKGILCILSAY